MKSQNIPLKSEETWLKSSHYSFQTNYFSASPNLKKKNESLFSSLEPPKQVPSPSLKNYRHHYFLISCLYFLWWEDKPQRPGNLRFDLIGDVNKTGEMSVRLKAGALLVSKLHPIIYGFSIRRENNLRVQITKMSAHA